MFPCIFNRLANTIVRIHREMQARRSKIIRVVPKRPRSKQVMLTPQSRPSNQEALPQVDTRQSRSKLDLQQGVDVSSTLEISPIGIEAEFDKPQRAAEGVAFGESTLTPLILLSVAILPKPMRGFTW